MGDDWQPIETLPKGEDVIVRGGDMVERLYRNGWVHNAPGDLSFVMPREWRRKAATDLTLVAAP